MKNQMLKLSSLVLVIFVLSACGTSRKTIATTKSIETTTKRVTDKGDGVVEVVKDYPNAPYEIYHLANQYYKAKKYEQALKHINKAIKKEKNEVEFYLLKSHILAKLERYKELEQTTTEAINIDRNNDKLYELRANARYFNLDYDGASLDYEKAITFNPQKTKYYHNYITLLKGMNRYNEVLNVFHRFEENSKEYTMNDKYATSEHIYFNAAVAYYLNKEYEKAITNYSKAIEYDKNHYAYYQNRGEAYRKLEQYEKALADCTKALSIEQRNAELYNNRGQVYMVLKEYEKAKNDFLYAVRLGKGNELGLILNLAMVYSELENHQESARYYKLIIDSKDLNEPMIFGNYGYELIALRQYKEAVLVFDKALELDKNEVDFYIGLAVAYYQLGNVQKTVENLENIKTKTKYLPTPNLLEKLEKEDYRYLNDFKKVWKKLF